MVGLSPTSTCVYKACSFHARKGLLRVLGLKKKGDGLLPHSNGGWLCCTSGEADTL